MNRSWTRTSLYALLLILLFLMPYSTWALQEVKFVFQQAGHPLPGLIQKAMTGWKEIILVLMGALAVWEGIRERKVPFKVTLLDRYLAGFALAGTIIGYLITHHLSWTVFGFRYDFSPFLYYFAARSVLLTRDQLLDLLRRLAWWSLPVLLFGLAQTLFLPADFMTHFGYSATAVDVTGNPLPPVHYVSSSVMIVRAMSTFPGPNSLALYAVMILLIAGVTGRHILSRGAQWLAGGLALAALVATFSRGHLIGIVAALFVGYLFWLGGRPAAKAAWRRYGSSAAVILILALTTAATVAVGSYRLNGQTGKLLDLVLHDSSSIIHKDVRAQAWDVIRTHPLGTGLGTSGLATTNTGGIVSNPESWYVQIMVEFGWLGLAAALALTVLAFRLMADIGPDLSDARDRSLLYFFAIGFAAVAVGSNFQPSWFEVGSLYWWILFGFFITDYATSFPRSKAL